jgi:hypothetical protein
MFDLLALVIPNVVLSILFLRIRSTPSSLNIHALTTLIIFLSVRHV